MRGKLKGQSVENKQLGAFGEEFEGKSGETKC